MHTENRSQSDDDSEHSSNDSVPEELPAHACSYCGVHNPNSVIRCGGKGCDKWFCNDQFDRVNSSHIIFHLVKAKHNEIVPHPEGQFGELAIECFVCGNTNIFVLGYVLVPDGNDSSAILLCRAPCVNEVKEGAEFTWNPADWTPIIQQKELVEWIARKSDSRKRRNYLSQGDMHKLEDLWRTNPALKFSDIVRKKPSKKLRPVLLKYRSGNQYKAVFDELLRFESKSDQKIKESQTQNNMTITFNVIGDKRYAYFMFSSKEDYEASLVPGNELKISYKSEWSSKGVVVKITGNEQVCLELLSMEEPPKAHSPYKVEFVWKPTSYHRMKKGLRKFENDHTSISSYLYHSILGQEWTKNKLDLKPIQNFDTPGLPQLNFYQKEAIAKAIVEPLCLIQGPPGTGKTVTSASIVYHLHKLTGKQILVCAPSNVVVDMLAQRIHATGLNVVRFCSKSRESVSSDAEELTLHYKLRNTSESTTDRLKEFLNREEDRRPFSKSEDVEMKQLKKKGEKEILDKADIICATCIASADRRLNDRSFSHVLIDQATQAVEPECLLPMLKSAKQVILVGDHLQLGPVVICKETAQAGLNKSLFERLVLIGHKPLRLQVQYRMHPTLSAFPSNTFYDGTLQNGISQKDRKLIPNFPWPQNQPSFFLNTLGAEELSASGTSYLNRTEAAAVDKILCFLEKANVEAKQIGIITPYKGQRAYIISYLQKSGQISAKKPNYYKQIEIASVDGYQGREKDYIIVSCVRSNDGPGIGFLKDPRRLNVTITRAKYGMIIVGNAKVFYQDNLWNNLLNDFIERGTLVEGSIGSFRPTLLKFPPPLKYNNQRKAVYAADNDDEAQENTKAGPLLEETPINSGKRSSQLGYTDIPEMAAFERDELFEIFSNRYR